jgi:pimeloyl-ACP methyl ester carboxylesterase
MRACQPVVDGYVERDGVKVFYEVFGQGEPTVLLLPTWSIVHSRFWKLQVPYLARHYRVLTFDGRGNGRSGRPARADAYRPEEFVADALAVLDAAGAEQAVVVGPSRGGVTAALLAALHPDRVLGLASVSPTVPLAHRCPGGGIRSPTGSSPSRSPQADRGCGRLGAGDQPRDPHPD